MWHVFLRNRHMQVKVGDKYSEPKSVPGGSPQGSVLGSFLFCAATDRLGKALTVDTSDDGVLTQPAERVRLDVVPFEDNGIDASTSFSSDNSDPPSPIGPPGGVHVGIPSDESEDEFQVFAQGTRRQRLLDESEVNLSHRWTASQLNAELGLPAGWVDPGLGVKVYIDDVNNVEKVNISNAVSRTWQGRRQIIAHAQGCERNFRAVKEEATKI